MEPPLSLSPVQSFLWTHRALQERGARNLSASHLIVAQTIQKLVEGGMDEPSHQVIAEAARCCARTVGEATRRLRALGMLGWEARYMTAAGHRRRRQNRYWLRLPLGTPIPVPELRRRRLGGICRASTGRKKEAAFEQIEAARAALARVAAGRQAALAQAWAATPRRS